MQKFGTAVILAGGNSTRMGFDKQFLSLNRERIINGVIEKLKEKFSEIIIVTNKPVQYRGAIHKVITDQMPGKGPLSGIHAGLKNASSRYSYFIACDMPVLNMEYIDYMCKVIDNNNKPVCITMSGNYIEPFNAFYSRDIAKSIRNYLLEGKTSVHGLIKTMDCAFISEEKAREFSPDWSMFFNLNTKEDIKMYLENIHKG